MKTILIPTDFKVESTKIVDALVVSQNLDEATLIFVHAFKLSDSITDMLMLTRRSRDYENISDEFYASIDAYRSKYQGKIRAIGVEYFYGSTAIAFRNFIEAREVDTVVYPKEYNFCPINKYSIDHKYLTARSGCEVVEIDINAISIDEKLYETKIHEVVEEAISA